jgi:hypothetical protein
MKTIWKLGLEFEAITKLRVPQLAKILTVQQDKKTNKPCIWFMVDTELREEDRFFELFTDGQEIKDDLLGVDREYIGTYQYQRGEFIGHVFEYTGGSSASG